MNASSIFAGNRCIGRKSKLHQKTEYKNCDDNHVHIPKDIPILTIPRLVNIKLMFDYSMFIGTFTSENEARRIASRRQFDVVKLGMPF